MIDRRDTSPLARGRFRPTRLSSDRRAEDDLVPVRPHPLLLWGICLIVLGFSSYFLGVLLGVPRRLFGLDFLYEFNQTLVWYSGIPVVTGIILVLVDLKFYLGTKRFDDPVKFDPPKLRDVTVALTAYNDESSIGDSVADFLSNPNVRRVIVVSNNSSDDTFGVAERAGALVFNEEAPGYGRCVYRCLKEAVMFDDVDLIVLSEGDMTFRAYDIEKLLAYSAHADIVNGTRTSETLRERVTQLSTFMYYGNIFVGKLLEAKHVGRCTLTDVGTTYKLCHRAMLPRLLDEVNPAINLEFNAHFVDTAIATGHTVVECPVTFHARVGVSKGGNQNDVKGFLVGLCMIRGILFGWNANR